MSISSGRTLQSLLLALILFPVFFFFSGLALDNQPPTAVDDFYSVHGSLFVPGPGMLLNDTDPDNDSLHLQSCGQVSHGNLNCLTQFSAFSYTPFNAYVGSDSFTYVVCDSQNQCDTGTVNLNVINGAPNAVDDNYTVHGSLFAPGPNALRENDSDPDNDPFSVISYTPASHGTFNYGFSTGHITYTPTFGYIGSDSITYQICDNLGLCDSATANFNVVNNTPVAVPDLFVVRAGSFSVPGPNALRENDHDPDNDPISVTSYTQTSHGLVTYSFSDGSLVYQPNQGYNGADIFFYTLCDNLGACTTTSGIFLVIGDGENNGECPMGGPAAVGDPVNVTNGNMFLQQNDYRLQSVGFAIDVTRTYNSGSQAIGNFGRGWSSSYDASVLVYDNNLARFNQPDGRAIYLGRPVGSTGPYTSVVGDFRGQLTQNAGGYLLTMKNGNTLQFSAAGKLTSLADRMGNQTTLTYDAGGKLIAVTEPFGRVLTVSTNAGGQITSISDALGTVATYTYTGDQLQSVTYPDNSAFQFAYDGNSRLTSVTDALGNVVESHTYDGQGRALTSARDGGVNQFTLNYVSNTETDVTDGLGRVTKYTIDKSKGHNVVTRVEGVCSCGGGSGSQVRSWTYDGQLNVTSETDGLNHVSTHTYDSLGNRLTSTDFTGTITSTYNQFGQVLSRTNRGGGVTTHTYDAQGNRLTTTDPVDSPTTFSYNSRGQLLTVTDARGNVTTVTYDANGNRVQQKDADNKITFYFYDARNRITKIRDAQNRSTLYAYDVAGRPNKITHPDNSFRTATYDLAGRQTVVTDERGNSTTYAYDPAYRMTSMTNAANQTTSFGYDAKSHMISKTDALSRVTNYEYDDFDRLKKVIYPPATPGATRLFEAMSYDAAGNVTQRTDTAGRQSHFAYDADDRLVSWTNSADERTTFEHDALSRLTAVNDPADQRYEFSYDAVGRPIQITRGGFSMSYEYDLVGNRTQRTNYNGVPTTYSYDSLNRLTTITYPSRTVTFGYLATGQIGRATNENGSIYIGYDSRYRVSNVFDPFFYGVSYNYDAAGNRTKLSLNGATNTTYTYDSINRLTNLKDSANQNFPMTYDSVNRLRSRGAPNGITTNYAYDDLDRLTSLTHMAGGNPLLSNSYQHDDAGNISSWTTDVGANFYGFDAADRLTSAGTVSEQTEKYTYDAVGNRTTSHLHGGYDYEPLNKLISASGISYRYDNNGNVIAKDDRMGTTKYDWNEENQLVRVTLTDGTVIDYKYDALGRRIQRTASTGANERYVYDDQDVLLDLNADWSVAATYLNGPGIDNKLRQTSATTGISYFLSDHLGSTTALADQNGNLTEQIYYDSFGNSAGSENTRYGFTGRERDPDTGLIYYRARFYDPQIGRFISEDPIGLKAGINFYAYVDNQPLIFRDPTGQAPWDYALFAYFARKCLKKGMECKYYCQLHFDRAPEAWAKAHPQYGNLGDAFFYECFQPLYECQRMIYYGGKAGVTAWPPGHGPLGGAKSIYDSWP